MANCREKKRSHVGECFLHEETCDRPKVTDRLIRFELRGEEINLFARARKEGKEVMLVGEAVLRSDDRDKLRKIKRKVELVSQEYGVEVLPIVVTHFATSNGSQGFRMYLYICPWFMADIRSSTRYMP